jgi:hypothetical protein
MSNTPQPEWLKKFTAVYQQLGTDNLAQLAELYRDDIVFKDAVQDINGLPALLDYFKHLYTNISYCHFDIQHCFASDHEAAVYWRMRFVHKVLNRGKEIVIEGHSHIKGDGDKVYYHKDYLDMGAMVYEHIPVLGRLVKAIKLRMNH